MRKFKIKSGKTMAYSKRRKRTSTFKKENTKFISKLQEVEYSNKQISKSIRLINT